MVFSKIKVERGLLKGGLVLLFSFGIFNLLNFVFHVGMARLLSVADYGILATLFSIIYFLSLFSESIQTIITKYAANEKNRGKLKQILKKSLKKATFVSAIIFLAYVVASIFLSKILEIKYWLLILTGISCFLIFVTPVTRGIMQGRKKFRILGSNMIVEGFVKLLVGVILVYFGWKVYGAIIGLLIGSALAFLISLVNLKDIIASKEKKANTIGIYGYSSQTFVAIFSILTFYSIDVVIAKAVFYGELAGIYAIASVVAKTIFWGTQPLSKVMFSLTSDKKNSQKKSRRVLFNSLVFILVPVAVALILFFFFSNYIIQLFSGKFLEASAEILIYLGLTMAILSFANVILLYKLSLGRVKRVWVLVVFLILEIVLLSVFTDSLLSYSIAFLCSSILFLTGIVCLISQR